MPETPIEQIEDLRPFVQRLHALGYTQTDELLGVHDASAADLAKYLEADPAALKALLDRLPRDPTDPAFGGGAPPPRMLGVRLDRIPRSPIVFSVGPPTAAPLPPTVNLIPQMRPVRDQANRGTCVAHAATAAAEHFYYKAGRNLDLSRQFLYWDCKQHDGDPNAEGTWLAIALPCLQREGCCLETTWPYNPTPIPGDEAQGPPPLAALPEALTLRIASFTKIAPTSVHDIKSNLAARRCVAFSIPVFNSWYKNNDVTRTGNIGNPIPGETEVGGHAMCMVGYEDIPNAPQLGGGRFYIRNSWDGQWATQSLLGVGYGTIPYSYIDRFGSEAYSIG